MFHFFSNCKIASVALKNYLQHKFNNFKMIKHLKTFDHDVIDPDFKKIDRFFLRRPNLLRYLIRLSIVLHIKNITHAQQLLGDYYVEIKNKKGITKKLFKNTTLKDILVNAHIIETTNKTDGIYEEKIINNVDIYTNFFNDKKNIRNIIINVDNESGLTLRELLLYNNINIYKFDRINFLITSMMTFDEYVIDNNLNDFLDKKIIDLL